MNECKTIRSPNILVKRGQVIPMELLKQCDWTLISFVGASLLREFVTQPLPSIQYWNGQREYRKKYGTIEEQRNHRK